MHIQTENIQIKAWANRLVVTPNNPQSVKCELEGLDLDVIVAGIVESLTGAPPNSEMCAAIQKNIVSVCSAES